MLEHPLSARQRVRAVVASTVGSSVEWYDFFLYGSAAALIFPKLYFPSANPLTGTLIAFSTYFVGFCARPLGALIFGHFGDRFGRKATLIATLLTMGVATTGIGLVPDHSVIGIWGGVALTLLRILQGIGVGGEWAGAVLLAVEWGRPNRRGFFGSWAHVGLPIGLVLGNTALLIASRATGADFMTYGWRIPFVLSLLLIFIGIYVRLGVLETPIFVRLLEERRVARRPIREVVSRSGGDIVKVVLVKVVEMSSYYVFTTFLLAYGTRSLKFSSEFMLIALAIAALISPFTEVISGSLSDVIGRKRMYLIGAFAVGLFAFPYFWLLDTRVPWMVVLAVILSLIAHDMTHGPQPALVAETFTGSLRYSGASLGYHLAAIVSGGPAPLIATWLLATYHSPAPIALMIMAYATISILALRTLPDRQSFDHRVEYEQLTPLPLVRVGAVR